MQRKHTEDKMRFTAKINKASERSLVITIPIEVVDALKLKQGDTEEFEILKSKAELPNWMKGDRE